jgi:CRISPR-associated protein Cas1
MLSVSKVAKYLYCPRLFFYEVVEGLDVETDDMLEGKVQHEIRNKKEGILLNSEKYQIKGIPDLITDNGIIRLEELKHGSGPKEGLWPNDRIQLTLYYLLLKENNINPESISVYYKKIKSRRSLEIDNALINEALDVLQECDYLISHKIIPEITEEQYKCQHCSMLQICQPELKGKPKGWRFKKEIGEAVYINGYNYKLSIKERCLEIINISDNTKHKVPMEQINNLNLIGTPQFSTQVLHQFLEEDKPVCFFTASGYFLGITHGIFTLNQFIREKQYQELKNHSIKLARNIVDAKIKNQHVVLQRRNSELRDYKKLRQTLKTADNIDSIRGIEGIAGKYYFEALSECIDGFDFSNRNKRPPKDPVNALLSYGYAVLCKDFTVSLYKIGFDPMYGFFHSSEPGRPALALDLMEPFRPILVDSVVLTLVNKKMISVSSFKEFSEGIFMTPEAKKLLVKTYEERKKEEVNNPSINRRLSYQDQMEASGRQLMRFLNNEISEFTCLTIK